MSTVAPEQTGFELDRFQWAGEDRLEVEGRWFGVRGRRFVRPVLTVQVAGRRRRLLALLEHKPWTAAEGEMWIAAFPWEGAHDDVGEAELEVGALTVDLPPPGGKRSRKRRKAETEASLATVAGARPKLGEPEARSGPSEPSKSVSPPDLAGEPRLRAAGETRQQLERDLASARAELGRLRARHEEEVRELRTRSREAEERLEAIESTASADSQRADALADEAKRLREELERVRAGQGDELTRMGASEAEARAELARERQRSGTALGEAERLRAAEADAAAETERLAAERHSAATELERLRDAHEEAQAEVTKLRQAARRSAAEVERLRAASRRPGAEPAPPADRPRPKSPPPSKPGPAVRLIPRAKPEPEPEPPPEPEPETRAEQDAEPLEAEPSVEVPAAVEPTAAVEPATAVQAPRMRPEPGTGAARLRGDETLVPLEHRGALAVWGPRLVAVVLVTLLLIALALIVRGVL